MDMAERNRQLAERQQQMFKAPFQTNNTPERGLPADMRVANALEYIASAVGRISERLESIDASLARIAASHPQK